MVLLFDYKSGWSIQVDYTCWEGANVLHYMSKCGFVFVLILLPLLLWLMKALWPIVMKIMPFSPILIGSIIRSSSDSLFNCKGTFGIQFLKCIFNEKHYILT